MVKSKGIISIFLTIIFIISVNCTGVFAAENNSTPEQINLQKAILEGNSAVKIASIPVSSEEEAAKLIEKLEETAETIEVEVTRNLSNTNEVEAAENQSNINPEAVSEIGVVRCRPTYGYTPGYVEVFLEIWTEIPDLDTWITSCIGYVAAATNVEGVRMEVKQTNFFPSKSMYVTVHSSIGYDFDTDLVLYEGYITVYLTGGWSPADIFLDHELYL